MAKKNTIETNTAAAPKRAATRRTTKPADETSVAADMSAGSSGSSAGNGSGTASYQPSADEIAQAAYQRYLSRGGADGRDFDDWIEAERELASRNTR